MAGNVGAAGLAGAQTAQATARDVATLEAELDLLKKRAKLTENQSKALAAIAELSDAGGDFLSYVRKWFEGEETTIEPALQGLPGFVQKPVQIYLNYPQDRDWETIPQ